MAGSQGAGNLPEYGEEELEWGLIYFSEFVHAPWQLSQLHPQLQECLPLRLSEIIFHTTAPTMTTSAPPMIQVAIGFLLYALWDRWFSS